MVLTCGLVVLILGTAANINAEEEYHEEEVHHDSLSTAEMSRMPLNLKEVEDKLAQIPVVTPSSPHYVIKPGE